MIARLARWETLLVVLLAASVAVGASLSPQFLTGFNFSSAASDMMERAIIAMPLMLVIITGEIDISIASTLGLASAILGRLVLAGAPFGAAVAVVVVVGALCGLLNGVLVARLGLPSLVVTLGTLALYRGLAWVVLGNDSASRFPQVFTDLGFGTIPGTLVPWTLPIFAALAIATFLLLHYSVLGRRLYAMGNNPEAARFSGIDSARIKVWLFVATGVVSAVAGLILTARFSSARADNGLGWEIDIVAAVLLGGVSIFGGRGSVPGVILGLLLLGSVRSGLSLADVNGQVQNIVTGCLLVFSVLGTNVARRMRARASARRLAGELAPARVGALAEGAGSGAG
jgi:rhamnose transport system permease protein